MQTGQLKRSLSRRETLYSCAILRKKIWQHVGGEFRRAIKAIELLADGICDEESFLEEFIEKYGKRHYINLRQRAVYHLANGNNNLSNYLAGLEPGGALKKEMDKEIPPMDTFPPHLQPAYLPPGCNSQDVIQVANGAYWNRLKDGRLDPARLAVLSDALEEAGCTNYKLLDHLREQKANHYRGCWALDWILEK